MRPAGRPRAALMLGHGAGGEVASRDLVAVAEVALASEVSVALVEQPYRVAGRRSPAPARQLDVAWTAVVERLQGGGSKGCRSSSAGARSAPGWPAAPPRPPVPSECSASRFRSGPPAAARNPRR